MVLGLIGAVVLASGSLIKAIAMILLGLLLGQINTDVISGVPRYSFDIPELTDGIGFVAIAMGVFGFGEIIANLGKPAEHREVFTKDVKGLWPTKQDFKQAWPAVLRGTALGSILGVLPGGGALLSSFAAYTVEKKLAGPTRPLRQGRHPRRGRPRIGQQRRRADQLHPDADAGHPAQRGDGADGRRDDDQGHPARPAGDDQQPGAVLGPDRQHVGRQPDAGDPEPAADRHLDQAADGALPLPVPGDPVVLLHRPVHAEQQQLRRLHGAPVRAWSATSSTSCSCEPAPLLLGFILGPMMEENLRRALLLSRGDWTTFATRPLSAGLLVASAADDRGGDAAVDQRSATKPSRMRIEARAAERRTPLRRGLSFGVLSRMLEPR
jgi:putative tricarboxylic transport membrane protein